MRQKVFYQKGGLHEGGKRKKSKKNKTKRKSTRRKSTKKLRKSKKKSKLQNKGGETFNWKIGDCVRPIGMPTYYTITKEYDKDNWLMTAPSGGGHNITDVIPKSTENSGSWEKVECGSGSKSKKKSKRLSRRKR